MKKFIHCILIACIFISCDKIEDPWENIIVPQTLSALAPEFDSNASGTKSGGLWVYQPESWDDYESIETRTYAEIDSANPSEYFQYWSEGDAISVFFTTANLKYGWRGYIDGKDEGYFDLDSEMTKGTALSTGYYYGVYPYKENTKISKKGVVTYTFPSTQNYNGDSYANGENGMIAIEPINGTDSVLYFQNFCSYLQLRLVADQGEAKTVKKISLIANEQTDAIAGDGTVEIDSEGSVPVVNMKRSATNQITLDCGSGVELSQDADNPTKFWFVVPGDFTFTQGFSVSIIFKDYSYFKKSTTKQINIKRSHIKPMAPFSPIGSEPNGSIRYKYNDISVDKPFPLNNTFYGEDGSVLDVIEQIYDEETNEWVVLLSGTLKTIGDNSFQGPGPDIEYVKVDSGDKSVIVNSFAFYNCTADSLIILNDVDEINESAFTGSTIKDLNIQGNVTTIKHSAGTGSRIENINITGSVQLIDEQAFSGCANLQTVNVGNVETIGYRAFYMCSNLTQVSIPGAKSIDMGAFRSCTSLEIIDLGSVEVIDDNAFMDCSSLTEVNISENCRMIGEGAFCNAVNLQTVYCHAVKPPFIKTDNYNSSYAFDNVHADIIIYIPIGSEDFYLDDEIFVGQTFDDPNIEAEVNWWYEEYYDILWETDFNFSQMSAVRQK